MNSRTPYHESFSCSLLKKVVQITGTKVTLYEGVTAIDSQLTHLSCAGTPTCGVLFGSSSCPYAPKA